ncbi:uncharacterized protein CANTADRAFT_8076 [Suhomyces tanzawaensis NRRL Y-17324]|uniref:YjgF-like protein n=1 Tax=Suhomyces tanzawaensis NRRL Y-17324 TaxID=984487 RepID=A0A1E4SDR0_9ASCO|nr:uncharacterized protein CANTADRAFT_8076 [Suhomyces tanzawaensis NRRL Y-17324]ODV77635.1 hypothetical protein CANTADRAFT_8076 [Suhomyces tanzawaensis NRRL Y-17324]
MLDNEIDEDQKVVEFDFPLPINSITQNLVKRHAKISSIIGLPKDDDLLVFIFETAASLCDPFTQPEETEESVLSVDAVSDFLIALSYTKYVQDNHLEVNFVRVDIESIKFELSLAFFKLLRFIHRVLNAENELRTRYVNNDEEHWAQNLPQWTPKPPLDLEEFNLKLIYSIACILILGIYKLFKPTDDSVPYNLMVNPYLHYLLKLWKCHTNIILLGLEIDRRIEFDNHEKGEMMDTPEIVKQTLKGSSSIRYILSWIINQNPSLFYDEDITDIEELETNDMKKESLLNFIQPILRKKINGGSLLIDMRLVIIGLLIINTGISYTPGLYQKEEEPSANEDEATRRLNRIKPITELGDILIDLEYEDRFDEDIRYIFEYEFEDEWEKGEDEDSEHLVEDEETDDRKINNGTNEMVHGSNEIKDQDGQAAMRSPDSTSIEFDDKGRDWRDVPRGQNSEFQEWFLTKLEKYEQLQNKQDSDDFFNSWNELYETFEYLSTTSIEGDVESETKLGQVVINSISKAIKQEVENLHASDDLKKSEVSQSAITPDKIYQYWLTSATEKSVQITQENNKLIVPILSITRFEIFLHNNSKLARCLMDEMLMCNGYRRVLIWFLTHNLNLSTLLIDYVFELLVGIRGSNQGQAPYNFTRKGDKLELSEIERLMLLHEFLTNSSMYLSSTEGIEIDDGYKVVLAESIAMKYMSLMCLMINQLMRIGIIDLNRPKNAEGVDDDIHDYRNELQVLLINWVGKLPEARRLFFMVKNYNEDKRDDEVTEVIGSELGESTMAAQIELLEKFQTLRTQEVSEYLENNESDMKLIANLARKFELYLGMVLTPKESGINNNELKNIQQHFAMFFEYFNTLCRIEFVAEYLFEKFETVISTGQNEVKPTSLSHEAAANEFADAEFSAEFLATPAGVDNTKPKSTKPKKSNKKKNRKKRNNQLRSAIPRSLQFTAKRMSSFTPHQVKTATAPGPAAPYSQAVKINGFVYVSGQIPYTAQNKPLPAGASIEEQAEQVIQNVSNILEAANSSLKHVVKANIFLTDMKKQFAPFNSVYGKYFDEMKPARSCVAVKELPLGVDLEMEVVAVEKEDPKL